MWMLLVGVLEQQCSSMLSAFKLRRAQKKNKSANMVNFSAPILFQHDL